ncbi:APC family permease [Mesomycoplasma neurolyticum]|uniref:Transporter, basic amino acid/polyamine antiporter (APA) family n=1 Tax=Mesomycoplasma neurolyticum TaxID=2120 RepID=A0A449A6H2_9BACT|nr:APC family permease [Mesomycoplasma neurolyticum]VEU59819.1 transporter, basic amino acid/polyamine antiporter (APA) family [Mesomycoplasma neurolyticum]
MSNKNKFSEKNFIFYGLNYIIGFGFIVTISSVISKGAWGILIFVLTAFIAMVAMLSYSRGGQVYGKEIGGAYAYAKKAFPKNRFFIFCVGWNQFAQVPLFAASTPLLLSSLLTEFDKSNQFIYQISSIILFVVVTLIGLFGIHLSKWFIFITSFFKWVIILLGFGIVVYLSFGNFSIAKSFQSNEEISIAIIASSILSFFYAFGGFEGLAGVSLEVKTKRFKKLLFLIFIIVFTFYFVFYLVFLFLDKDVVEIGDDSVSFSKLLKIVFGLTGSILFIIGALFRNFSSTLSSSLYYSRIIASMANDNFIPKIFAIKNKNNEYKYSLMFAIFVQIIAMIILGIIPYYLNLKDQFSTIISAGVIVFFMQYIFSIFSILIISNKTKEIKISIFEKILYVIGIVIISLIILINIFPFIVNEPFKTTSLFKLISYVVVMLLGFAFWALNNFVLSKKNKKGQLNSIVDF